MATPHAPDSHDTHDIVVAAAYWLMHRYQHIRCRQLAWLIEQHLQWVEARLASPALAQAYPGLVDRWDTLLSGSAPSVLTH